MTTENQNQELPEDVNIFDMSPEDFAKLDFDSPESTEEPADDAGSIPEDSSEEEQDSEQEQEQEEQENQEQEEEPTDENELGSDEDEYIDVPDDEEDEDNLEDAEEDTFDYASEYKRLIGKPIKANGKEITIDSVDDAIKFIQMGANYYKKVEQLKPAQKIISMLEKQNMLDEGKLSFAIDLLNKNPEAINKLISDAEIDKFDLDPEKGKEYKPTKYSVSDKQVALDNALKDIKDTPTYQRTVTVIGSDWDEQSRNIIMNNPEAISFINDHISSGIFDTVSTEVEKRKMLGTIPKGLSDIEAYKMVGDSLYAQATNGSEPNGQQDLSSKANESTPIRKPSKSTVTKQKRAAKAPRSKSKPSVADSMEDVLSMSSEEFHKKYGF